MSENEKCPKCQGTGMIKESNGTIHVCYNCLAEGKLDVHSKEVKDSGVKV
ncbi:MAG: hypothetical protein KKA64_03195 [Nanoarchaeota archaeon]|nr:hypothetical protein [Nanoarchaeota archaeon]